MNGFSVTIGTVHFYPDEPLPTNGEEKLVRFISKNGASVRVYLRHIHKDSSANDIFEVHVPGKDEIKPGG